MPSREFLAALEHFPKGLALPGDSYEDVRRKFAPAHGHDPGPDIAVEPARFGGVGGVWVDKRSTAFRACTARSPRRPGPCATPPSSSTGTHGSIERSRGPWARPA